MSIVQVFTRSGEQKNAKFFKPCPTAETNRSGREGVTDFVGMSRHRFALENNDNRFGGILHSQVCFGHGATKIINVGGVQHHSIAVGVAVFAATCELG